MKYWKAFTEGFHEKYFDQIANGIVQQVASYTTNDFFQSPNIMLYGLDISLLKLYVDAMLSRIFGIEIKKTRHTMDINSNNNKYVCPFYTSGVHIEIDLEEIRSAEKQFLSDFLAKHISQIKNIKQPKHIVVLHHVNTLHAHSVFAMRKILESHSGNVMFILTTKSLSGINDALKSRAMLVRCSIAPDKFEDFLENFVEEHDIDVGDGQLEINYSDGLVYNLVKLGEPNQKNVFEDFIKRFIDEFLVQKDVYKATGLAKAFAFKVLHFNITLADVLRISLKHLSGIGSKKKGINMVPLVRIAADLEHKSHSIGKPYILIERFFLEVLKTF